MPRASTESLVISQFDLRLCGDRLAAFAGFARGLCPLSDSVVAGGSSPSTVTIYDLKANQILMSVNLTRDIRNAIHGLEVWPYD